MFNFFQNKRKATLILVIFVALFLCAGGFWLYQSKFKSKADTVVATDNLKLLANLSVNNGESSGTVIKLSDKFTDDQISTALSGSVTRSAGSDAILQEIRQKAKDLANQPVKGQSTIRSAGQEKFVGDLIIDVRNSKGERIAPLATRAVDPKPATVADNFDFDASLSPTARQIFIDVYPKIEAIYGQRSSNKKIKVLYDTDLNRSYFNPSVNEIHIANGQDSIFVITHELTHAFHGNYCLISVWEEGMAQTVAFYINNLSSSSSRYEIGNTPQDDFVNMDNPMISGRPYMVGQDIIEKLFTEDKNFFKKFNSVLYQQPVSAIRNFVSPIAIASQVLPSIEGQTSANWFSHQYALIPVNSNYSNQSSTYSFETSGLGDLIFGANLLPSDTKSLNIKGFGSANELKFECDQSVNSEYTRIIVSSSSCSKPYQDLSYSGLMKFVITINGNASKSFSFYAFVGTQNLSAPIFGTVVSNINPVWARVTNIDNGWKTFADFKNKGFYIADPKGSVPGRYKIDLMDSAGKTLKTQYFNKRASSYEVQVLDLPNDCSLKDWQVQVARGGINGLANLNKACFNTLSLNGVPIERGLAVNYKTSIKGLAGEQAYNLGLNYTNALGNTGSVNKAITTLALFKIVKQEIIGVPSQHNFKLRLTFNDILNMDSPDSNFKDLITGAYISLNVVKINDLVYDFVPQQDMADSHDYKLTIRGATNLDGYSLQDQSFNYINFTTPGAVVPVAKYTITPSVMTNGSISPSGTQITDSGKSITYTAKPDTGYILNFWSVDGKMVKDVTDPKDLTYTLANITANHTILATFTKILVPVVKYTITPLAMTNGSISPNGTQTIESGKSVTYTAKPAANYNLDAWFVDGKMAKDVINVKDLTYTLVNITANHTIVAYFTKISTPIILPATAQGTVTQSGKGLPAAAVKIVKSGTSNVLQTLSTASTGIYQVSGLPAGNYTATATIRKCKKYWFISICGNTNKSASFGLIAGKNTIIPTIAF